MKKMLFVYNPRSGKGLIRTHLSTIIETFSAADYEVTVYPTKKAMDACEMVQERACEFDLIACSGGDGTLDEVVTGLMHSGISCTVGYIPAGSTNDFANSIGIPKQMDHAARVIVQGEPYACDIGRFNDEYFVYVAAFGIFTDVSYQTNQEMKNAIGHAAYLLEGMRRVGTWKSSYIRYESDECSGEGEFVYGMVTNSNSVGGIKGIPGKNIELNDGLFEVTLVRAPQNITDWQDIITAVLTREESPSVLRFKARKVEIFSEEPLAWTRDGENGGEQTHVVLENMQQMLSIMTPKQADAAISTSGADKNTAELCALEADEIEIKLNLEESMKGTVWATELNDSAQTESVKIEEQ